MKLFEEVNCDLCGSTHKKLMYKSTQYSGCSLGQLEINIVLCLQCNFLYQNPQLTNQALEKHYQENSSGDVFRLYDESSKSGKLAKERNSFITTFLSQTHVKHICDVGGGEGIFLSKLSTEKHIKKYLIEPSSAIEKCTDNDIIKINQFFEDIGLDSIPKFDLIAINGVLEHLKQPSKVLAQLSTLISKQGAILIEVPNSLKAYDTFAEFYSYEHINHFSLESLSYLLEKCGLYTIKLEEGTISPSIRLLAKKKQKPTEVTTHFQQYIDAKNSLETTIKSKINNNTQTFAIYGAGDHSNFILEKFDLIQQVSVFIDSDPKKWGEYFHGKLIIGPKEIDNYQLNDILISSHDFEFEIQQTILRSSDNKINIMTLYS